MAGPSPSDPATYALGVRVPAGRVPGVTAWTPRSVAVEGALRFGLIAAAPRWARRARWVGRLGPRGLAIYVLLRTVERYVTFTWVVPGLLRTIDRRRQWREELEERLGREPTEGEVREDAERRARELHPRPTADA